MAKIIDTKPDRIEPTGSGQYLFYFVGGRDLDSLHVGATYVIVYSPTIDNAKGRVVLYQITLGPEIDTWAKEIKERPLTDAEIAHFEGLIAGRG